MTLTSSQITDIVNAYFSYFSVMNAAAWAKLFTPDAQAFDPVGNLPSNPQADSKQFFDMLRQVNESLEAKPESIFIGGNEAAVKWSLHAVSKSQKEARAEGISIFVINESGLIEKVSAYWDDKAFMAQFQD